MCKLINFTNLNKQEILMVLEWRNHNNIRKWMKNTKKITLKEHSDFLESLKNSKDKDYFLVKKDDSYIGVVDLNGSYLGVYSNPDKKRVGDTLLDLIIDFAFHRKKLPLLKAKVYKKNQKAIDLYKRHQFILKNEELDLLTMELKNENS